IKNPDRKIFIVQAALLSVIGFYIKISNGLVEVLLLLGTFGYAFFRKKLEIKTLWILLLSYILLIFLAGTILNVYLPGYIRGGLNLISGYNEAMLIELNKQSALYRRAAFFIIAIFAICIIYALSVSLRGNMRGKALLSTIDKNLDDYFAYGVIAAGLFVMFKAAFVRADDHIVVFFRNISLLAGLLYLFNPANVWRKSVAIGCTVVMAIAFWGLFSVKNTTNPKLPVVSGDFFSTRLHDVKKYFSTAAGFNTAEENLASSLAGPHIWKQLLGNASVDVFPIDISEAYFNDLWYNPRPIIQSYSAYNNFLDSLNYEKYMSPGAPDYILYTTGATDDRYPFFDESKARVAILNHYTVIGKIMGYLLLKKRESASTDWHPIKTDTVYAHLNEDIPIAKTGYLQYSRFSFRHTLYGKLKTFFLQPPALQIRIILNDGEVRTYNAIRPILEGGVLINKFIITDEGFQAWLLAHGRTTPDIRAIRLEPNGGGFSNDIQIVNTYYPASGRSEEEKIMDNQNITAFGTRNSWFFDKYKPTVLDTSLYKREEVRLAVDDYIATPLFISLDGWAFREKSTDENAVVRAVLLSKDKVYELPSFDHNREDLGPLFKRTDIKNCGFISMVSPNALPAGDYELGVSVVDTVAHKRTIGYTGRHVNLRGAKKSGYEMVAAASLDSAAANTGFPYSVDEIEDKGEFVQIRGWAYSGEGDARASATNLILKGSSGSYRVKTTVVLRHDVAVDRKNPLMAYSGFIVLIPKQDLPSGLYTIGIEKADEKNKRRKLSFTDKKLDIE
ncbi:MAG TPA: hypothetical protein VI233_03880, partial [Puia sp.]